MLFIVALSFLVDSSFAQFSFGVGSAVEKRSVPLRTKSPCANNTNYCEGGLDDPAIINSVTQHWDSIKVFNQINSGSGLESRRTVFSQDGAVCTINKFRIRPTAAMTADTNGFRKILNTNEFAQYSQIERCQSPGAECENVYPSRGYRSTCRQVYTTKHFLTRDERTGKPEVGAFLLESGCACHLEFE